MCPRYLPFVLLRHLHPTNWSWWKSEASFCAPRGPMRAIYEDRIWQTQFPSCCTQNTELFTATSPFTNHQPTTVPVWAQNLSLQTRLHMTCTSENYWGVNLLTYLLTYFITVRHSPSRGTSRQKPMRFLAGSLDWLPDSVPGPWMLSLAKMQALKMTDRWVDWFNCYRRSLLFIWCCVVRRR